MPNGIQTLRQKRTQRADVFGHIPGNPIGTRFDTRLACSDAAVHPGPEAGIYGRKEEGAYSIVLSGGYEDDKDEGDCFTYTGSGGRDTGGDKQLRTGPQTHDQSFENPRNAALKRSVVTGKPVRVVRGYKLGSPWAPAKGYRYDGLYKVVRAYVDVGEAGYKVCKFDFVRLLDQDPLPDPEDEPNTRPRTGTRTKRQAYSPLPEPKFEGVPVSKPTERLAQSPAQVHPAQAQPMKTSNKPSASHPPVSESPNPLRHLHFKKKAATNANTPTLTTSTTFLGKRPVSGDPVDEIADAILALLTDNESKSPIKRRRFDAGENRGSNAASHLTRDQSSTGTTPANRVTGTPSFDSPLAVRAGTSVANRVLVPKTEDIRHPLGVQAPRRPNDNRQARSAPFANA